MFVDILKFLVIFGIAFIVFASVGMIMFRKIAAFQYISSATIYLFTSALGGFDFTVMDSLSNIHPWWGKGFLIIFLIVMMITLLNFVIALMSDTYSILSARKDGIFLKDIILLRQKMGHTKTMSCIVSAWVPFNIVTIIFTPLLVLLRSSKMAEKLNTFLLHIIYIPIGMFGTVVFGIGSLICIPFAYIMGSYSKGKSLFHLHGKIGLCKRILDFFLFFIFGLLILALYWVIDIILFILNLYNRNLKTRSDSESMVDHSMNLITFAVLKQTIQEMDEDHGKCCKMRHEKRNHKCYIPTKWLVLRLQKKFGITEQIKALCLQCPKNIDVEEMTSSDKKWQT